MKVNRNLAYAVVLAMATLVVTFAPFPLVRVTLPKLRTFRVQASQFGYVPSELNVNPGDTVVIQLISMDVVHGLYIDGYDISVEADPGQSRTLTFIANKAGSFRFRCSVTCGAMHPFMLGKLNVGQDTALVRAAGLALLGVLGATILVKQEPEL